MYHAPTMEHNDDDEAAVRDVAVPQLGKRRHERRCLMNDVFARVTAAVAAAGGFN